MTTTATPAVDAIAACLRLAIGYGEMLVKDIPAEQFAHQPIPNLNHPAFCLGHLCLYPDRMLTLMDRADLTQERAGYKELFAAGVECSADADRYPPKDELVACYLERYGAVADVLPTIAPEVLARPNPAEGRFREMCPTVGAAVNFLSNGHHMVHLGQISAWRRVVGLGGVM
ncbi:MAG: DinB family protein [Phycisphaerales bacterium]|nr:DinB family protein [Phycisphaerae bacterium]NNF44023.1 DinB family protein [Phycisphaerales bacterium]NNM24668.1 DinB family protein [Phycisphaerales bacterium]